MANKNPPTGGSTPPADHAVPAADENLKPDTPRAGDAPQQAPPPPAGDSAPQAVKTFTAVLRHKSPYPHYRRAGLLLDNQFKPYPVTAGQIEVLKRDAWVEIQAPAEPGRK